MNFFLKIFSKKSRPQQVGVFYSKLIKILDFEIENIAIYTQAFTHRSLNKIDADGNQINYERLEFLGDAVLGNVIALYLYNNAPHGNEGYLTKMRSKIVSRERMNQIGKRLNLTDLIFSKIGQNSFGENIYGNLLEALIGAIYLDKGFGKVEEFIYKNIIDEFKDLELLEGKITSYKSIILEFSQKNKIPIQFETYEDESAENIKYFAVKLYFNNEIIAKARATSKKKAEEKAAQRAYFALQNQMDQHIK